MITLVSLIFFKGLYKEPIKLKIGLVNSDTITPSFKSEMKNELSEKEGIDAEFVFFNNSNAASEALSSGTLSFSWLEEQSFEISKAKYKKIDQFLIPYHYAYDLEKKKFDRNVASNLVCSVFFYKDNKNKTAGISSSKTSKILHTLPLETIKTNPFFKDYVVKEISGITNLVLGLENNAFGAVFGFAELLDLFKNKDEIKYEKSNKCIQSDTFAINNKVSDSVKSRMHDFFVNHYKNIKNKFNNIAYFK